MNTSKPRLAIIEDHADLREELQFFLQAQGYACWGCDSAESFWKQLHFQPVDIVLVDLGLPGEDGFSVVEHLNRLAGFGRVIISARGDQEDRLRGLSLGADLYLVKPINFSDLCRQIDQLWRRLQIQPLAPAPARHAWQVDAVQSCLITPTGQQIRLSGQELALVEILLCQPGEIHSRESLHGQLFGLQQEPDDHRIDVILHRLRKKARDQRIKLPLRTLFGKGIAFVAESGT